MKRIFLCFVFLLALGSTTFASEDDTNFEIFYDSLEKVANQISWSGEYKLQDIEFVENEMLGDETVYARAWYDDYYLLIRKYRSREWSKSFISEFSTSSEELIFPNGIKVGAPFSKVKEFFGKGHVRGQSSEFYVAQEEDSDGGGILIFSVEDGVITSISYFILDNNQTSKMRFLYNLYAKLYLGEVTGEKVNVREYAPNGKVRFQVSQSKGDRLLVDVEERYHEGWYQVAGRITDNSLKTVPYYEISKQFVKVRKLTPSERKIFFSQYKK